MLNHLSFKSRTTRTLPLSDDELVRHAAREAAEVGEGPHVTALDQRIGELQNKGQHAAAKRLSDQFGEAALQRVAGQTGEDEFAAQPIPVTRKKSYDEANKIPLWKELLGQIRASPGLPKRLAAYRTRVNELVAQEITDEKLAWSLNRMDILASQEGILRPSNVDSVNRWHGYAEALAQCKPEDFDDATVAPQSLMKMFKETMDREESVKGFQFTGAHSLHDHIPYAAHFLGNSLQERVLAVALKGHSSRQAVSIWGSEEMRHGQTMEDIYAAIHREELPTLERQGIATRDIAVGEKAAKSLMAGRALAELSATTAYWMMRANARPGSGSDRALRGISEDEWKHYILMAVINHVVYGQTTSSRRIYNMLRYGNTGEKHEATDKTEHQRKGVSPLLGLELLYAARAIDKRIQQCVDTLDPDEMKRLVGPVYRTDKDVDEAVAAGKHTRTPPAWAEQNPDYTKAEVEQLAQRFPTRYSMDRRVITTRQIDEIVDTFRKTRLAKPGYWSRKVGLEEVPSESGTTLEKNLGDGGLLRMHFPVEGEPVFSVLENGKTAFQSELKDLGLRQVGKIMDAEDLGVVDALGKGEKELSYEQLVKNLSPNPEYQEEPLELLSDFEEGKSPSDGVAWESRKRNFASRIFPFVKEPSEASSP